MRVSCAVCGVARRIFIGLPSVKLVKFGACARELMGALLAGVFCGVLDERLAMVAIWDSAGCSKGGVVDYCEDGC
jgi:hypothetical protein